ncbi:uncharacterized protein LOC131891926 [Tigriopus californicus]|uniref:uncharacterized protein LOC131891926 n=1 Tax=Tigriopus californicus TaxID=6832 RepID=UPI0027DA6DDB|nr:uncharacterized protein LOC131891926 [Tigriopus californicus]
MLRYLQVLLICIFVGLDAVNSIRSYQVKINDTDREGKLLSLFQIIRFPNQPCIGQASKNGTCYTADECSAKSGTNSGSCAQGYGVCCTFSATCGQTSNENCTYFESAGSEIGGCSLTICPCGDNICQLRLDFNQFMITGPSTSSDVVSKQKLGVVGAPGATKAISLASRCLTDTFSVTSTTGQAPPSICGINTGEHMYVDSTSACNDLVFQLGNTGQGTGIGQRQWNIKVTQYSCDYPNLAPDGCTQYYFGSSADTVQTYNYVGGQHLASQDQNICIRRERGNCRICYTTVMESDFMTSGETVEMAFAKPSECCGYGSTGGKSRFDCVVIPGALNPAMMSEQGLFSQFCGRSAGLQNTMSTQAVEMSKTICTDRQPFNIRFLSDSFEAETEIMLGVMAGFKLTYFQTSNGCN